MTFFIRLKPELQKGKNR